MNIVVIDDDSAVRASIRLVLKRKNWVVAEARNGADGLALVDDHTDLVLVDLVMPDKSGIATIRSVRASFPHLPIIAMSGSIARIGSETADEIHAIRELGTRFLSKPFRPHDLIDAVALATGA